MIGLTVDAHGTLIHLVEPAPAVYARLGATHGHHVAEDVLAPRMAAAMRANDPATGAAYWRAVVAACFGPDEALFEALFAHYAEPAAWRVDDAARQLVARARDAGHPTAVVSNIDSRLHGLLAGLGLAPLFDTVVLACEVGAAKPDPAPFREALRRLGVARAVHAGDHETEDVTGARSAGLAAVAIAGPEDWARVAVALGLSAPG